MSKPSDWIPKPNDKFRIFADNLCAQANANAKPWNLDTGQLADIGDLADTFNEFHDISKIVQSRTRLDVENTDKARVPYEKALRKLGQGSMKNNPSMTDTDRTNCGVPNNKNTRTKAPVADNSPVIEYEPAGRLGGKITSLKPGSTRSTAKPEGQVAVIVKFAFYTKGDDVPAENACTQTELLSRSPQQVVFPEEKFGLMFIAYARYVNTRQQPGKVATVFEGMVS